MNEKYLALMLKWIVSIDQDLTSINFGSNFRNKVENRQLVKTQSGLIVPPRSKKKFSESHCSLVRTQSGQIIPPRTKKLKSNSKLNNIGTSLDNVKGDKIPPTPPKRKKHLQIEKINQLFMNFANVNGQERMQLGMKSNEKFNLNFN